MPLIKRKPRRALALLLASSALLSACAVFRTTEENLSAESWLEVSTENFTITSNASRRRTEDIARSLELFRNVVLGTTSVGDTESHVPTFVFVFRNESTFSAFATTLSKNVVGYFRAQASANYAVIQADVLKGAEVAQHEYVHFLMYNSRFAYPRWYNEGVAELLSTVGTKGKWVDLGRPPSNAAWLLEPPALPLKDVVTARNTSGWHTARAQKFYAKSWLLTHYLHFEKGRHEQLLRFLRWWNSGRPTAEAFEAAFEADYASVDQLLAKYQRKTKYFRLKREKFEKRIEVGARPLPQARALSRLGWLLLSSVDQASDELSLRLFRKALAVDPRLAPAHAGCGVAMIRLGEAGGEAHLEKALELEAQDPRLELAYADYLAMRSRQSNVGESAGYELAREAERHYNRCLELDANLPACHLGVGLARYHDGDLVEAAKSLEEAHALLPSNTQITLQLSQFYMAIDFKDRARQLLEEVEVMAHSDRTARIAGRLLAELNGPADSPDDSKTSGSGEER